MWYNVYAKLRACVVLPVSTLRLWRGRAGRGKQEGGMMDERRRLLAGGAPPTGRKASTASSTASSLSYSPTFRSSCHDFLEARTTAGSLFEACTMGLIALNVLCFILSTDEGVSARFQLYFDVVELCTVLIFSLEWIFRAWSIVEERDGHTGKPLYDGCTGRLLWASTDFFSLVDLASILPYYVDLLLPQNLPASQFIRLLRLFRVMRAEGRYIEAFTTFDDIFRENQSLLATSGFVGATTWLIIASFYHLAERDNARMIWEHPGCYNGPNSEDAGSDPLLPPCLNRYRSITSSLYYTLLNLFGEFPLVNEHSASGRVVAIFTACVAVAVFAIPTGIMGAGFEDMISRRREEEGGQQGEGGADNLNDGDDDKQEEIDPTAPLDLVLLMSSRAYESAVCVCVCAGALAFALTTVSTAPASLLPALAAIELTAATLLTFDFVARIVMAYPSRLPHYILSWYGLIDLGSVAPFLVGLILYGMTGTFGTGSGPLLLRALASCIRLLKLERYFRAFAVFGSVVRNNSEILIVSGFAAVVMLIFSSTLMYFTEKHNPDPGIAKYYTSIPNAMWMTLLNLSGESPLCDFTPLGKVISGFVGLFAVGIFGVSVGLVGAGFEEFIEEEVGDNLESEVAKESEAAVAMDPSGRKSFRRAVYTFLEARTEWGQRFEAFIMALIVLTVAQAIATTVDSVCPDDQCPAAMDAFEAVAVSVFTAEYFARFFAAPEDPQFKKSPHPRLSYLISFYSVVDVLAIFPFYLALVFPLVDQVDDYLRLLRMFRLLKIDKYVPSVSLIDDVFRVKAQGLKVSGFAAGVLWIIFSTAIYLAERNDATPVDCLMESERFESVPRALQYDLILLIGDYPLIDFTSWGRLVNVLQIVLAVGVVAVPSGLIASGFTDLLEERKRQAYERRQAAATLLQRQVRGHLARKRFREAVEGAVQMQREHNQFLEQRQMAMSPRQHAQKIVFHFVGGRSPTGNMYRVCIAVLIVFNCIAVILESEPSVGGPTSGPLIQFAFDAFEAISVAVFSVDYAMRIFAAPADGHYGSSLKYMTGFYGCVDFVSVAPWYLEMALGLAGVPFDASTFRVLRLFRLLQLDQFVHAFSLLGDVWRSARSLLAATGLLALIVWVGLSTLFFLFERNNECTDGAFVDIPSAMYFVAIFLGG
jgi:hypothetical protein